MVNLLDFLTYCHIVKFIPGVTVMWMGYGSSSLLIMAPSRLVGFHPVTGRKKFTMKNGSGKLQETWISQQSTINAEAKQ